MRPSGREAAELRMIRFTPGYTRHAEGSVLAEFGDTRVLCTASIEDRVPPWAARQGRRLGHRGVRHVAALDTHAIAPRSRAR